VSAFNIPDGGYDPADLDDEDEDEYEVEDDVDESEYVEESDWEERVERHWFPGPK
jgi:hypothetical protein